jgi:hypothetical protein
LSAEITMKPINLYESLFILHKCQLNIDRLWKLIEVSEGQLNSNSDYSLLFTYHINLEAVNFLDEYNGDFVTKTESEYLARVKETRKITAPILKRINKWKDLQKFRNNIIAHPWRDKGRFVVPNSGYYNIPRNWFEIAVFVNLLKYVWSMIRIEFLLELKSSLEYIATIQTPAPPANDYLNLNADHYNMATEVNDICQSLKKKYYLKVFQYVLPSD